MSDICYTFWETALIFRNITDHLQEIIFIFFDILNLNLNSFTVVSPSDQGTKSEKPRWVSLAKEIKRRNIVGNIRERCLAESAFCTFLLLTPWRYVLTK